MTIYIDIVFIINFIFDLLLLLTVSIILKRNTKIYRVILGSFIGALSIFILFVNINNFTLFLIKLFISIIMIIVTFGFKNFYKNFIYLYFVSIILGGFIYFINNMFSYKVDGIVFINNGFSINIILLIILSPIILYFYIKESRYYSNTLSNIYNVKIKYKGKVYNYNGYLDTGNKLRDPYKKRGVSILYDNKFKVDKYIFIPYNTLSSSGLLKGVVVEELVIDDKIFYNQLIGVSDNKFNLDSCNMILHSSYKRHIS